MLFFRCVSVSYFYFHNFVSDFSFALPSLSMRLFDPFGQIGTAVLATAFGWWRFMCCIQCYCYINVEIWSHVRALSHSLSTSFVPILLQRGRCCSAINVLVDFEDGFFLSNDTSNRRVSKEFHIKMKLSMREFCNRIIISVCVRVWIWKKPLNWRAPIQCTSRHLSLSFAP